MEELLDGVALALRDPEQLRELADGDEEREAEDEAPHHRLRDELRDEPEPQEAGEQEQPGAEEHHRRGAGG